MAKVLENAQRLYDDGKWTETIGLLNENIPKLTSEEDVAEAVRIKGWCFYYIGIKGPEEEKREALGLSRDMFDLALKKTSDTKKKLSIFNGLPLSLWILGEKKQAWQVSNQAIKEFPDEPSVWNTRSILCRWAKNFKESEKVCEKVYETALAKGDYRTAGHGKHNKADALKELGWIGAAREEYNRAIELYGKFEEVTGQSAKFHIEGVEKKLANL